MQQSLIVDAMGVVTRICAPDSADNPAVDAALATWRDLAVTESTPPELTAIVGPVDASRDLRRDVTVDPEPADNLGERLASALTLAALEHLAGTALLLHAGAIALDDGGVVGFVGPSGRGKTTAMTVLGRTHGYVTDETLVVRPDGSVIPYPKPLLVGRRPEVKTAHAASSLGLVPAGDRPLRLAALVLLDRRDDCPEPVVAPVDPLEAIVDLARESSYLSALDRPLHTLASLLRATGGARRVSYTEAETLPEAMARLLACDAGDFPLMSSVAAAVDHLAETGTWIRAPYVDALVLDDRLMVLRDQTITVLDGIAPAVWTAATGAPTAQVTEAVLREHPAPSEIVDPGAIVASTAEELEQAGLLRRA
jgi:hypothetical protein